MIWGDALWLKKGDDRARGLPGKGSLNILSVFMFFMEEKRNACKNESKPLLRKFTC